MSLPGWHLLKSQGKGRSCLWMVTPRGSSWWPAQSSGPKESRAHVACVEAEQASERDTHSSTAPEVLPLQGSAPDWCPSCTRLPNLCCHLPRAITQPPAGKIPYGTWELWETFFYFFKDIFYIFKRYFYIFIFYIFYIFLYIILLKPLRLWMELSFVLKTT